MGRSRKPLNASRVPRVRIPLSPPYFLAAMFFGRHVFLGELDYFEISDSDVGEGIIF